MSNPILSWRRVRALCVKRDAADQLRDPSSWLIAVVILLLLFILDTALTSRLQQAARRDFTGTT